jgi:type I restriction enzyme M protein
MIKSVKPDSGEICTVIDEGVLNTEKAASLRRWLLKECIIRAVVRLPPVTFKPNKINVRASVLYMMRRDTPDIDYESQYLVRFLDMHSLGYHGSGENIRGFDEAALMDQVALFMHGDSGATECIYANWRAFSVPVSSLVLDATARLDLKYWETSTLSAIQQLESLGCPTLSELSVTELRRGISPPAESYVDEKDGYAHVVKAGTNINRYGELVRSGDFIEKNAFEELSGVWLHDGDLLVSSTGDGTLGKCAVYRGELPAIADGHVAIVRLDQTKVFPEYVCDYLRLGFGAAQIRRLFTGSTGLVELAPDQLGTVRIEYPKDVEAQKHISQEWRLIEKKYRDAIYDAEVEFTESRKRFLTVSNGADALAEGDEQAAEGEIVET